MIGHERIVIQTDRPLPVRVVGAVWANANVTVTTSAPHLYESGDTVTITGAVPAGYNGTYRVTVTGASTFTYPKAGQLPAATGPLSASYAGDTHGGHKGYAWRTLTTIWGKFMPIKTYERLQRQAVEAGITCRFHTPARHDLVTGMRAVWTPHYPPGAPARTLVIAGIEPDQNRAYMFLECAEVVV